MQPEFRPTAAALVWFFAGTGLFGLSWTTRHWELMLGVLFCFGVCTILEAIRTRAAVLPRDGERDVGGPCPCCGRERDVGPYDLAA